jgi:prolyl 4-hydroxylase
MHLTHCFIFHAFCYFCHGCRSDVEEGGETVFPAANQNFSSVPWWDELSECGKGGLSVKPKMGDVLLFWSMRPDATLDPSSLHG